MKDIRETGEIIALFPEISEGKGCVLSYLHIGQHGAASIEWAKEATEMAYPLEYSGLWDELTAAGYKLSSVFRQLV